MQFAKSILKRNNRVDTGRPARWNVASPVCFDLTDAESLPHGALAGPGVFGKQAVDDDDVQSHPATSCRSPVVSPPGRNATPESPAPARIPGRSGKTCRGRMRGRRRLLQGFRLVAGFPVAVPRAGRSGTGQGAGHLFRWRPRFYVETHRPIHACVGIAKRGSKHHLHRRRSGRSASTKLYIRICEQVQ